MFSSHADRIMCVSILLLQNLHCFYIIIFFNKLGEGDAVEQFPLVCFSMVQSYVNVCLDNEFCSK